MELKQSIAIAGGGSTFTPGIIMMLLEKSGDFSDQTNQIPMTMTRRDKQIADACEIILKERAPEITFIATTDPRNCSPYRYRFRDGPYPCRKICDA